MTYYILCSELIMGPRYDVLDSDGFITVQSYSTLVRAVNNYINSPLLSQAKDLNIEVTTKNGIVKCIYPRVPDVVIRVVAEVTSLSTLSDTHPELFL